MLYFGMLWLYLLYGNVACLINQGVLSVRIETNMFIVLFNIPVAEICGFI